LAAGEVKAMTETPTEQSFVHPAAEDDTLIRLDLRCAGCEYNLRGLRFGGC
jgi:hypothetical protein